MFWLCLPYRFSDLFLLYTARAKKNRGYLATT